MHRHILFSLILLLSCINLKASVTDGQSSHPQFTLDVKADGQLSQGLVACTLSEPQRSSLDIKKASWMLFEIAKADKPNVQEAKAALAIGANPNARFTERCGYFYDEEGTVFLTSGASSINETALSAAYFNEQDDSGEVLRLILMESMVLDTTLECTEVRRDKHRKHVGKEVTIFELLVKELDKAIFYSRNTCGKEDAFISKIVDHLHSGLQSDHSLFNCPCRLYNHPAKRTFLEVFGYYAGNDSNCQHIRDACRGLMEHYTCLSQESVVIPF